MIYHPKSFWQRLKGLIGQKDIGNQGLYFHRCSAIHTCFMSVPITVIFWDKQGHIIKYIPSLKPWRYAICFGAQGVFEFRQNRFASLEEAQSYMRSWFSLITLRKEW